MDILIGGIVLVLIILAIVKIYNDKKKGKGCSSCGCCQKNCNNRKEGE